MKTWIYPLLFFAAVIGSSVGDLPCIPRQYNHSSVVCVCNATYCDEISPITPPPDGEYILYTSTLDGLRFNKTSGYIQQNRNRRQIPNFERLVNLFKHKSSSTATLSINRKTKYQSITGFGGAFTDSAGLNIASLSTEAQWRLINTYYGSNGIEYNMGRVPIGGTDFSTYPYAYNEHPVDDVNLSNFTLTREDFIYKIPYIKSAQSLATDEVLLFSAAWSPPLWMKTNNAWGGASRLKKEYYQTWADYHLKFIDEYSKRGMNIWGISTGNEPSNGIIPIMAFNSLGWIPTEQGNWVKRNLGPTIRNSQYPTVKIMALDDQRFSLPWWINWMTETGATDYLDGVAVHWYWDDFIPPSNLDKTHQLHSDLFILATEACVGDKPWQTEKVALGSWKRAEMYARDILEDLNHWAVGWVDWNLALDSMGGPNWFFNYVDAPIITMPKQNEFLKQPLYYALGHFSKFLPRDSIRIASSVFNGHIDHTAFLRPDGRVTVILHNPTELRQTITIKDSTVGVMHIEVRARSLQSLVY